jgi:glycerol-3-phosphate acyltransferase PlsY
MTFATSALILFGGYIAGSISPSYILGRLIQKIDIREHGTKNAGTVNTYKILGLWPAVTTAVFDLFKGLFAMYAASVLGASPLLVHLAGFAAVLGHVFPFYLNFKGGQGVATAAAILIYYLALFYINGWLPWVSLLFLAYYVVSFVVITKKGEFVGVAVIPLIGILVLVFSPPRPHPLFVLSVLVYILYINIHNIWKGQLLTPPSENAKRSINWRHYARPFAVLLIIDYIKTDKKEALTLIGAIVLFFLILDLIRLFSKKINVFIFDKIKKLYKSKEYKKFSSITLFLVASFLTVLLFEKAVAILAVCFLIFGDFFSKFFGIYFGRKKLFEKTLEGSLAHLNACVLSGYIVAQFVNIPTPVYLVGALVASITELLPMGVDDNFSVALISASAMYVLQLF